MISSPNNAAVKKVVRLRKRRERLRRSLMLVEGHAAVGAAIDAGTPLVEVFHTPGAARRRAPLLTQLRDSTARVVECSDRVMAFLAGTDHPPDVLAVAPMREATLAQAASGDFPVVLSEIRDPSVVGGIMAAAAGAGATSVIAMKGTADVFAPAAIRAAAGAHFVVHTASGHDEASVAEALGGRRIVALLAEDAEANDVADAALKPPLALIVCGGRLPGWLAAAERVSAGGSTAASKRDTKHAPGAVSVSRFVGPGIGARAAIALEEIRRGASR